MAKWVEIVDANEKGRKLVLTGMIQNNWLTLRTIEFFPNKSTT